jgi:hypothetical protein
MQSLPTVVSESLGRRQEKVREFLNKGYFIRRTGKRTNSSLINASLLLRKKDSRT